MQKAHALYRQHVIKLEQNAEERWRITAINHSYNGSRVHNRLRLVSGSECRIASIRIELCQQVSFCNSPRE